MYFTGTVSKDNNRTHSEAKRSLDPPENEMEQLDFVLSHPQHRVMVCVLVNYGLVNRNIVRI